MEAQQRMNDARDVGFVLRPMDGKREHVITLASLERTTFPEAMMLQSLTDSSGDRSRWPVARQSDGASLWRAADRALAEIAAANRTNSHDVGQDHRALERATSTVREALNEAAVAAAEAARRALTLAEALDEALAVLNATQGDLTLPRSTSPEQRAPWPDTLSQREEEVLAQVARGRSNKAIADELYVSPNTVKTHVASLLRKLDVHTRAQLAAIAVQRGLS